MRRPLFKLIEDYSKKQMGKLGLYGWPHVQRVLRLSEELAKLEGDDVDMDVLKIAALLHDVAKRLENKNPKIDHGIIGAEMAKAFLTEIGLPESKVKAVCHAIKVHTHSEEPTSTEARILHDAGFLDKLGATGLATIFLKACFTNKTIEEVLDSFYKENQSAHIFQHIKWIKIKEPHFYTKTAMTIAKKRNRIVPKFFNQLRREIMLEDFKNFEKL